LTGANDNKVLIELSDDTKQILNTLQDEFERNVIDMDKTVCSENEGWGRGIKKFNGIFSKANERKEEVFSRVKKPILSNENLVKYGITDENDLKFFHTLNDLKSKVNAEKYYDRPTISEVYFELLCDITGYLTPDLVYNLEDIVNDLAAILPPISVYGEVMYDRSLRGAFWFIKNSIKNLDAYKPQEDAVQIMTVHASKGLEFPVVILASIRENGFPSRFKQIDTESVDYTPEEFLGYDKYDGDAESSHIEEEERILYVAKTRAEDELILSSIMEDTEPDVKNAINDCCEENIRKINKAPERINDVIDDNLEYAKIINPENIDINILDPKHSDDDEEIINLSFTALENYNECPFKYKMIHELGFNVTTKKEIDEGIFIHSALEIINKKIKANNNEYVGDEEVTETVERLFKKANIKFKEEQPEKYDETLEAITNDVKRYYHEVGNNLEIIASEYPFYIRGENYAFSGFVDLIYEKDGKLGIIDYKNTSLVSSPYLKKYRKQLHFYVMALRDENKEFEGHKIEEIQIYAIRYKGGKLFSFDIEDEYIEELKEELKTTAEKIRNKEFEADCEDCTGCPYRKICKK
ncbi:MAG: PD-(D/E)XK nuclease family protein, partial [Methanobrevibacter sp.]|nr:PD-(D/E)XK nuclease family protein [Methanobrevibacter sp.]